MGALADVKVVEGPAMIKSENGRLLNYVTLNVRGRDIVGFVDEARRAIRTASTSTGTPSTQGPTMPHGSIQSTPPAHRTTSTT